MYYKALEIEQTRWKRKLMNSVIKDRNNSGGRIEKIQVKKIKELYEKFLTLLKGAT